MSSSKRQRLRNAAVAAILAASAPSVVMEGAAVPRQACCASVTTYDGDCGTQCAVLMMTCGHVCAFIGDNTCCAFF